LVLALSWAVVVRKYLPGVRAMGYPRKRMKAPKGSEAIEYVALVFRSDMPVEELKLWLDRLRLIVYVNGKTVAECPIFQCEVSPPMSGRFVLRMEYLVHEGDEITAALENMATGEPGPSTEDGMFIDSEISIRGSLT
jgi:hypothetical protein